MKMYLTVQRVASREGARGINGALYEHGKDRRDPMWRAPDVQEIATSNLGNQVARRTDVRPGGNSVECFLDIIFPDDVSEVELRTALSRLRREIVGSRVSATDGLVSIVFSQNLGEGARAQANYDQLFRAAIRLFRGRNEHETDDPLEILATIDESGWHFSLTDRSRRRLEARNDPPAFARVNVPLDVADDFRRMYGELYPFVMEWVTALSRADLAVMGGVRIFHDNTVVWEWPRQGTANR